jgi:DNA-binding NtrC family response regulator
LKLGKPLAGVDGDSLRRMMQYQWPGNVRELQNLLEREAILAREPILHLAPLPSDTPLPTVGQTLAEVEAAHIKATLDACHWRISGPRGAASSLGLPPSTLRSRMQKLGICRQGS